MHTKQALQIASGLTLMAVMAAAVAPLDRTWAATPQDAPRAEDVRPGMSMAVIEAGKPVRYTSAGYADLEARVPFTEMTPMNSASLTKNFTAGAIAILEEEGKLSVSDDVRKYLPWVPDYGTPITLKHLLDHTSGLRSFDAVLALKGLRRSDPVTSDRVVEAIKQQRGLNYKPGAQFLYGNTGFFLLSQVVEVVSGKPYPQFMQERVFGPLHMTRTVMVDDYTLLIPGRAAAYGTVPGGRYVHDNVLYGFAGSANIHTTSHDLGIWGSALLEGRGPAAPLRRRLEAASADLKNPFYTWGTELSVFEGSVAWEHGGQSASYSGRIFLLPNLKRGAVSLSNGGVEFMRLQAITRAAAVGKEAPAAGDAEAQRPIDPAIAVATVGTYRATTGVTARIWQDEGRLKLGLLGTPGDFDVTHANGTFSVPSLGASFQLAEQKDGVATLLRFSMGGGTIEAARIQAEVATNLSRYVGAYYNCDLQTTYEVSTSNGGLEFSSTRFTRIPMSFEGGDRFNAQLPVGQLVTFNFEPGAKEPVAQLVASVDRARSMRFDRIAAAGPRACGER